MKDITERTSIPHCNDSHFAPFSILSELYNPIQQISYRTIPKQKRAKVRFSLSLRRLIYMNRWLLPTHSERPAIIAMGIE
jgi:hypothetical protein